MHKDFIEETAILNFMSLVLDMQEVFNASYSERWRDLKYNFYAKKYRVYKKSNTLCVQWLNLNDDRKYIKYFLVPFRFKILNKLFNILRVPLITDDPNRFHNILVNIIFPDFCDVLDIKADFSGVTDAVNAGDLVVSYLYKNYFTGVSLDKFFEMFGLNRHLSSASLLYIRKFCGGVLDAN